MMAETGGSGLPLTVNGYFENQEDKTMRAVILEEFGKPLSVQRVAPKPPLPRQVVVELGASGVCHSDLSMASGMYPMIKLPLIAGHEGAGIVVDVGSEVRRVKKGDRVIASFVPACGECFQCHSNASYLCELSPAETASVRGTINDLPLQFQTLLGTMAEAMTVHEDYLVKIDTDLPDEQLALMGCGVTTGLGAAMWTAKVTPGSSVAVFGAGGVGIAAIQGARIAGAAEIIAVDPAPAKKDMAFQFGATQYVDPSAADPVEQIKALTRGRGVDFAIEVVGIVQVMEQAYWSTRRGGTVVFVGALGVDKMFTLPANELHAGAKTIIGCANGSAQVRTDFGKMISLVETGRLELGGMISRRYPLEGINEAYDAMTAGEVVRSILVP
jgi:S-(hydroxymethyl)glutathione dehydrogenase / alcohol dehydrogenase